MTGHQIMRQRKDTSGDLIYAIDIPALCRAIGVKNAVEATRKRYPGSRESGERRNRKDEASVIITKDTFAFFLISRRNCYIVIIHRQNVKMWYVYETGMSGYDKECRFVPFLPMIQCVQAALCASLCKI